MPACTSEVLSSIFLLSGSELWQVTKIFCKLQEESKHCTYCVYVCRLQFVFLNEMEFTNAVNRNTLKYKRIEWNRNTALPTENNEHSSNIDSSEDASHIPVKYCVYEVFGAKQ